MLAPDRVAIFRALPGLGDFLCMVPALRALRAAWPDARVTLIGLPTTHALAARFGQYIDDTLAFPGYPGLIEQAAQPPAVVAFLVAAQACRFDLALQLHGSGGITNPLVALLGARQIAGCYLPGAYCPDPDMFVPYPEGAHEIWRMLRVVERLGVPLAGDALAFPLTADDYAALHACPRTRGLRPDGYVCIHPGAADPARRWPTAHFAAVADGLAARGLRVVLTGTDGERELTGAVQSAMCADALDLAGQTGLGALAALLADARLLVANDTGVSHLAAALQTPSVVLFQTTDPRRWGPLDDARHRVLAGNPAATAVIAVADDLLRMEVCRAA